ncbi:hypothetical protein KPL70_022722 [Citrus sinensis]|uniref:light-inducible protein CPRF3-like n=1 Tax=Citrus sinensis TaxID=2711 RepID=UPI0021A05BBC|nr:light-inducible protein CPRF3-like [Citrus sinensis]XP_052288065.1 light-inducible protein CPRF3-like [Citrus sinensis]KAH9656546.1 hypothetical protein KPL70_022722 [Citrus sinensis]KAH9656547.1 hypothetical protein KPL70_022722 [Citrus sinensis]
MKAADSICGNNNAYNASNSSASVFEESEESDESIDINRDIFATKREKINQMHEADDDILAQKNVTVCHSNTTNLASRDSAESMIKTTQNSGIVINESGTGARITKDSEELKLAKRRQSNRESARRSRMRKQEEFKKLQKAVEELKAESAVLKDELLSLSAKYGKLKDENEAIVEELKLRHRADAISYLEALMPHNLMNGESYRREENLALFQSRYASSSSLNVKASSSKKFRQ